MPRPRVFVSSTYYDLKHIRSSLEIFVESLGFDAVLFERGDIAFTPDQALDESCYREASNADIFVIIIGGRYGSPTSGEPSRSIGSQFYEQYNSITRQEFESAQEADVPTFILIENGVYSEYQTYTKNRKNETIQYAHVQSVNVFHLIDSILERSRNNPVYAFERASQIEQWLREQWAGFFRELLRTRSQQKQLVTLSAQVDELRSFNETFKAYLEAVLGKVNATAAAEIIKTEDKKLRESLEHPELRGNNFYSYLRPLSSEDRERIFREPKNAKEAAELVEQLLHPVKDVKRTEAILRFSRGAQSDFNRGRLALGLPALDFSVFTPNVLDERLRRLERDMKDDPPAS